MGSYFGIGSTRREMIEEVSQSWENETTKVTRLRYCTRGNTLYALMQTEKKDQPTTRWILVALLLRASDGWGYKPMDESMGPCEVDCPLEYLNEATEPVNDWAREWRERVRASAKKRERAKSIKVVLAPGDTVYLEGAAKPIGEVTLIRKGAALPLYRSSDNGRVYRFSRRQWVNIGKIVRDGQVVWQ